MDLKAQNKEVFKNASVRKAEALNCIGFQVALLVKEIEVRGVTGRIQQAEKARRNILEAKFQRLWLKGDDNNTKFSPTKWPMSTEEEMPWLE